MLDKILSFLADFLKTDNSWTTLTSTTGTVQYRVVKGFVWIFIENASCGNTWTTIATLPSDLKPSRGTYAKGIYGSNGRYSSTLYVNTNGQIRLSADASATAIYGTIIYPLI